MLRHCRGDGSSLLRSPLKKLRTERQGVDYWFWKIEWVDEKTYGRIRGFFRNIKTTLLRVIRDVPRINTNEGRNCLWKIYISFSQGQCRDLWIYETNGLTTAQLFDNIYHAGSLPIKSSQNFLCWISDSEFHWEFPWSKSCVWNFFSHPKSLTYPKNWPRLIGAYPFPSNSEMNYPHFGEPMGPAKSVI